MAVTDFARSAVAPAGLFAGLFGKIATVYTAWATERQTRAALSRLSDRELEDIGLCRGDIDFVARSL
ncbi:DUF1127 domain-containing protein [Roseovarius faecimaris]|uniref:DUF1127 domain-containing protein n=1 Tax=Roseovarius faecimaris TaxID=2494550 RepID=A0A6I6IT19_9RHOB|nr:DUF1127 domain-containing protein [Roseovarius faecimaris]QGX99284.1 DUF1127 domain-containing protein [Roseovarius faecimaris]